jgi:arsenate reductase
MAEEFLNKYAGDVYEAHSAGFIPTEISPVVVSIMKDEEEIDLSKKKTHSVIDMVKAQHFYGYVITVCDKAKETECPTFPGVPKRLHWNLANPEDFSGTNDEIRQQTIEVKNQVKKLVLDFIKKNEITHLL